MRRIAALAAAAVAVTGCGESTTHDGPSVAAAFRAAGLPVHRAPVIEYRRAGPRITRYEVEHALLTLASHHTKRWLLLGRHDLVVAVLGDPVEARHEFDTISQPGFRREGLVPVLRDNVIAYVDVRDERRARAALDRL